MTSPFTILFNIINPSLLIRLKFFVDDTLCTIFVVSEGVSLLEAVDLNENRFKISTKISTIVDKKTLAPEDNREEASVSSLSFSQ